jgi:hypothetical protein
MRIRIWCGEGLFRRSSRVRLGKEICDFPMSRFSSQQLKRPPICVTCSTQSRKAAKESCNPFDLASADCMCEIFHFNPQKSAQFSQVFNRPACWCCAEFAIPDVDVCTPSYQFLNHGAVSAKSRVVKGCGTARILLVNQLSIVTKNIFHPFQIALLRGLNQSREFAHTTPPIRNYSAARNFTQTGWPTSRTFPVGVSLPVFWSTWKITMLLDC